MNKTVSSLVEIIKPGQPVLVIGDYGSGKYQLVREAVKAKGLVLSEFDVKEWWISLSFEEKLSTSSQELKDFMKSGYDNSVRLLHEISYLPATAVTVVLEQMLNSERYMVLLTRYNQPVPFPILDRCQLVQMTRSW